MKTSTAIIALGAMALLAGSLSLYSLLGKGSPEVSNIVEPAGAASGARDALPSRVAAPVPRLHEVDPSIERVLMDLGLAVVSSGSELSDIPAPVVRVLAAREVALTVAEQGTLP